MLDGMILGQVIGEINALKVQSSWSNQGLVTWMKWVFASWNMVENKLNWSLMNCWMRGWLSELRHRIKGCTNYGFLDHKFHQEP